MTDSNPASNRCRWLPTFQQWRLGILMSAVALGLTGMIRNDARLVKSAIAMAMVGVLMRIYGRLRGQTRAHQDR